jgi:hypothetical protein
MKSAAGKFVCALLLWPVSVASLAPAVCAQARAGVEPRPRVTATLESSGGQYFLTLNNDSAYAFRGLARLSLGNTERQTELGQLAIVLAPDETRLLRLDAVKAAGEQYTLRLYDQRGVLIFYKVASVRAVASAVPSNAETVALTNEAPPSAPMPVNTNPAPAASQAVPTPEVQIKPRLIAGARENDPFIISFDLTATKAIMDAALNLITGKAKQSKAVSINRHAVVEFNLPEYLESNQIDYTLTRKDGSVVAQGTANLDRLFADDHVTIGDLRTDRVSYAPGETARITIVLEGQSPRGYKLEVLARDQAGSTFFNNTVYGEPGEAAKNQEFTFTLPLEVKGPVIFEFKVYDAENNTVFDSGERELAVKSGQ